MAVIGKWSTQSVQGESFKNTYNIIRTRSSIGYFSFYPSNPVRIYQRGGITHQEGGGLQILIRFILTTDKAQILKQMLSTIQVVIIRIS